MYRLHREQLKLLAEFIANLGVLFFATIITTLFVSVDTVSIVNVVLALIASITCLVGSLLLLRKRKNNEYYD